MPLHLPIRTTRLLLRDFVVDDFDAVHAYGSDPEVTRYMFYGPRTRQETRDHLADMLASQRAQPRLVWELGAIDLSTGRLVRACDLTLERPDGDADLGYILSREARGGGFATEAAGAMVRAGFQEFRLNRIVATCDVDNFASAHVLEKAGLHRESTLERHKHVKGKWWTSFQYSIQRSGWSPD